MVCHGERQWTTAQDFDVAATRRGVERHGPRLRLRRGVTVRDESGRTNIRHTERIAGLRQARKVLVIERLGSATSGATLCPYVTAGRVGAKLEIRVNGRPFELTWEDAPSYWWTHWQRIDIPVHDLREGENEVVFRALGQDTWHLLMEHNLLPGRSAVSEDGGQSWRGDEIGDNDRSDGEYVVRLHLDQHEGSGEIASVPLDLLATAAGDDIAPSGHVTAVAVAVQGDRPPGTRWDIDWRQGDTPAYHPARWSAWQALDRAPRQGARYGQWRLRLATADPSVTPTVEAVTLRVDARIEAPASWHLAADTDNAPLVRSSFRFAHMSADDRRGQMLRRRWQLDEVIAPAQREFEALVLLRQWVRQQWEDGWNTGPLDFVPPFDAPVILELAGRQLALGMCTHYATVFTQCCAALGFHARTQIMRSHCVTEVWSKDHRKWVTMDVGGDSDDSTKHTYHFERQGVPLSALEAHRAHVDGDLAGVEMVPGPPPQTGERFTVANRIRLWERFMIHPRNDETATLEPGEPEHGKGSYHYDGYLFWQDEKTPPLPYFSRHTDRPGDLYWDLQAVHLHLQAGDGVLVVDLDADTPNFDFYEVRVDSGRWQRRPARFEQLLHPGENRLEARSVNVHGRCGPVSHVTVVV